MLSLGRQEFRVAALLSVVGIFVGGWILTGGYDGAGEDNRDRDAQRLIFCMNKCDCSERDPADSTKCLDDPLSLTANSVVKPCKHVDVKPPRSYALHGVDLCKDNEWIGPIANLNELKKELPSALGGSDDPEDKETRVIK